MLLRTLSIFASGVRSACLKTPHVRFQLPLTHQEIIFPMEQLVTKFPGCLKGRNVSLPSRNLDESVFQDFSGLVVISVRSLNKTPSIYINYVRFPSDPLIMSKSANGLSKDPTNPPGNFLLLLGQLRHCPNLLPLDVSPHNPVKFEPCTL